MSCLSCCLFPGPRDAPETLLLLHGTPAWSFLYRRVVPGLLDAGYRVVALDQIGFGRSDKLTNIEAYSHELHVATVLLLLEKLDLKVSGPGCPGMGGYITPTLGDPASRFVSCDCR